VAGHADDPHQPDQRPDKPKAERVFKAMMDMRKIDIATLQKAAG
jgi:hypothetical protein